MGGILQVDTIQNNNATTLITQTNVTTITIGTSGQNISIPSGATLTGPGAGLIWQSVQTTSFTAVKGEAYPVDTTSAAITVTLPATPTAGDQVQVVDYAGTADTNQILINPNGEDIEGGTDNLVLRGEREGVILTYIDSTQGWIATSGINEGTNALEPNTFLVDFLVIAGGGGGGAASSGSLRSGAGGGAGGYRELTSQTIVGATNYIVTVGAGGSGSSRTDGANSVFGTITSTGGGKGGFASGTGGNGGSGGGGGSASGVTTAGTGISGQGFAGGAGTDLTPFRGGGGGGATAVGTAGTSTPNGGAGAASSITGSSVTRAGGGGGGGSSLPAVAGSGGTGGGGDGSATTNGTAGTANTGGGGGGGAGGFTVNGGNGGSGIVIIKYPDAYTISNPGGGLTSSTATAGGFSVTSFTAGTGTIQFN
jgi:hypothetical protein